MLCETRDREHGKLFGVASSGLCCETLSIWIRKVEKAIHLERLRTTVSLWYFIVSMGIVRVANRQIIMCEGVLWC